MGEPYQHVQQSGCGVGGAEDDSRGGRARSRRRSDGLGALSTISSHRKTRYNLNDARCPSSPLLILLKEEETPEELEHK